MILLILLILKPRAAVRLKIWNPRPRENVSALTEPQRSPQLLLRLPESGSRCVCGELTGRGWRGFGISPLPEPQGRGRAMCASSAVGVCLLGASLPTLHLDGLHLWKGSRELTLNRCTQHLKTPSLQTPAHFTGVDSHGPSFRGREGESGARETQV